MKRINKTNLKLETIKELNLYYQYWWWSDDYDYDDYETDNSIYKLYSVVKPIYSKQNRRDKIIESLFSEVKDYITRIEDFYEYRRNY